MSQVKVVELNVEGKRNTNLPPIVHTIRQQGKKQLNELLQDLFNNTDDALFELADRSQSDQHQEMYFDSMRMIRLHRKTLASNFIRGFYDSFDDAFFAPKNSVEDEPDDELDEQNYSLLDQDELEMNVAVAGIVSKVTSQHSLAIMQLTKRMDYLAKAQTVTERTNPLGPHALSTAFSDAMDVLEVDIKIRIILMKLFERFVMERLGPIIDNANRALIEADVLADLKNKPPRRRHSGSAQSSAVEAETLDDTVKQSGMTPGGTGAGFNTVQSLLAGAREVSGAAGLHPSAPNSAAAGIGGVPAGNDVIVWPALKSSELIQALSHLQNTTTVDEIDIDHIPELCDIRSLVLSQPGTEKKSLDQSDDDTVNFVGMLFDYILNDRNLAIPMKALIGRLQIPIIKLAVIDKSFFDKSAHPARALLNELSSAGIGWSGAQELKRDALYNKIESVVLRVLNEFSDNPGVFTELLEELRDFVSKDSRRSVLVEQRVKESEAGKAKTNGAKLQVQTLVNQKASGLRLPSEAGKFISEVWSRVLTLRVVKFGESSSAWSSGVATLDDLLWTLQPLSEANDIKERDACAPKLLQDIHEGMIELGCAAEEADDFNNWLAVHLENLSENDRAYLEEDERPQLDICEEMVEDIVLAAPDLNAAEPDIEPEYAEKLKLITEGTWVEILTEEDRKLRCKLATITQPGNNYIFVNRRGMKVLEKTRGQLAELFKDSALKLIDESQVFDRALQSVIGNLRQMQRERVQ